MPESTKGLKFNLKGDKKTSKKKKSKRKRPVGADEEEDGTKETVKKLQQQQQEQQQQEDEEVEVSVTTEASEKEEEQESDDDDDMTPAEKRAMKFKDAKLQRDTVAVVSRNHRDRIEEFNEKLGALTELNDLPRISAAGNG
jgi:protein FAM32A